MMFWKLYIRTPACIFSCYWGYSSVPHSSPPPFPAQISPLSPSFFCHCLFPSLSLIFPQIRATRPWLQLLSLFRPKLSSLSQFYISCSLGKGWEKEWIAENLVLVMALDARWQCLHCNDQHCRHQQGLTTQIVVKQVIHGKGGYAQDQTISFLHLCLGFTYVRTASRKKLSAWLRGPGCEQRPCNLTSRRL